MRECMLRSPAVFGPMLADVDDAVGSGSRDNGGGSETAAGGTPQSQSQGQPAPK